MLCGADLLIAKAICDVDGLIGILANIAVIKLFRRTTQLHLATQVNEAVQPRQYAKRVT